MATPERPDLEETPRATPLPDGAPPPPPAAAPPPSPGAAPAATPGKVAFRKKASAAAQGGVLAKMAAKSRMRGVRTEDPDKKYSVGDQLQKTATGPSKLGRAIKIALILIVVVGIPGLVGASFFVRVGKKKEMTAAQRFWKLVLDVLDLGPPPKPPFVLQIHPKVMAFDEALKELEAQKREIGAIAKVIEHAEKTSAAMDKETALALHAQVDACAERTKQAMNAFKEVGDWWSGYNDLKGQAGDAYDKFIGTDSKKKECTQFLIRGEPVPYGLAEAAKDPGVLQYIDLCKKLELDRYEQVTLEESQLSGSQKEAVGIMGQLRMLRGRLPSKVLLGGGTAEGPGKESVPPYDPKGFHPWARAAAGTWVRYRITMADGAVSWEDRIVKEAKGDGVVFAGQRASGDQVTDEPEREEKFVPADFKAGEEEKVKVGEIEIPAQVIQAGEEKRWIARSGRWANRVVLKTEKGGKETLVTRLAEEALPFKERQYNCIAYEFGDMKFWAHEDVPGFVFKLKTAAMIREVVDFGIALESRPPFPKAEMKPEEPKKEEPKPEVKLEVPKHSHPWTSFKPGAWVRIRRVVKSAAAAPEVTEDTTFVEASESRVVLKVESPGPDGNAVARERREPVLQKTALREEKLAVGGAEIPCVVVEAKGGEVALTVWIPKEGPAAGLGMLKHETPEGSTTAVGLSEEAVKVGEREVKCVRMELEGKANGKPLKGTVWLSATVPGFVAKQSMVLGQGDEEVRTEIEALAFGEDASQKPPFPSAKKEEPPKPEPPKEEPKKEEPPKEPPPKSADILLAEAEKLVIEGGAIFQELVEAAKQLPEEPARLQALLKRQEEAVSFLTRARETYLSVREKASPEAKVDERLGKVERILALLQKYGDRIKSKLK